MSGILFRYIVRTYLAAFAGILAGGVAIFLVADFVDRARMYSGPGWVIEASILYGNKALLAIEQLGPAALLLAAGAMVTLLRRRGELTALSSLTLGPAAIYLPVALCALVASCGLVAFDEVLVVDAGRRVDEINATRFNRWGDWSAFFSTQKWFRRGNRIFYLRQGDADTGFGNVTLLELTPDFRLARRVDARRLVHLSGTTWALEGALERTFARDGSSSVVSEERTELDLGTTERPFRIRQGRPEQMRLPQLREQIRARRDGGLPYGLYALALHNRFAYALAGLPAALLAVGLALRPGRRAHLTGALVEGLGISVALWALMVVLRTVVVAQRIPAGPAAWAPAAALAAAAAALWLRREGWLGGFAARQREAMSRR
jgi:lipopolysaccharide export system permease protein